MEYSYDGVDGGVGLYRPEFGSHTNLYFIEYDTLTAQGY